MVTKNDIDIKENTLRRTGKLLDILLTDQTTGNNILWATASYKKYGEGYNSKDQINAQLITGKNCYLIQPRASKLLVEQRKRTKDIAEVFTPLRIIKEMNDLVDKHGKIDENNWQEYVKEIKLEITCGEAPFIASRYDPTSHKGTILPLNERVGFLDRKLRVVSEYCDKKREWVFWAKEAYKASYGYEWQGDNLLIARENLLYTFIDYYVERFNNIPSLKAQEEIAKIVSWNIFQMDGLKYVIPMSCYNQEKTVPEQTSFIETTSKSKQLFECEGCKDGTSFLHNGVYVKIMDWEKSNKIQFSNLISHYGHN